MIETKIQNIFDGYSKAYIYIWLSLRAQIIYIGMTNSITGTLGRAAQHVSANGTLRLNILKNIGTHMENYDDYILFSFLLPTQKEFISVERSYREGVEFLVQKQLRIANGQLPKSYSIVSRVRYSPRVENYIVKKLADEISTEFLRRYSDLTTQNN